MAEHVERSEEASANSIRLPPLSPAAADFVRQHPPQARLAVSAALEAAAAQFESLTDHNAFTLGLYSRLGMTEAQFADYV
jgi:hypothetical protein